MPVKRKLAFAPARLVRVFISYSHDDKDWMGHLLPLLIGFRYHAQLIALGGTVHPVHIWHDGILKTGNPWDDEIRRELASMDIFVPLVSHYFFGSEYIQEVELPEAVKRYRANKIKVVPIHLNPTELRARCPFLHGFPPLPMHGKTWCEFPDKRDAHMIIANGLCAAIEEVLQARGP